MIARTWRGWTSPADADEYVEYIRRTGIDEYRSTPGNLAAYILRRDDGDRTLAGHARAAGTRRVGSEEKLRTTRLTPRTGSPACLR